MPTGSVTPAGGGGGPVPVYETAYYSGTATSVANGSSTALPWNIFDAGTALLNLTTPTQPLVLKAGLFIICAQVSADAALTPGGAVSADLILDYGNDNVEIVSVCTAATATELVAAVVMGSYVLAAGAQFRLYGANYDGVSARSLSIKNATVARIGPA